MLEITDLHSGYGHLGVLKGITLGAAEGELVAVIGANGAGKTTLLKTISGLLPTTSGTVRLDGERLSGRAAEKIAGMGLAHVPENRLVFPTLTVRDNLELGAWTRRKGDVGSTLERVLRLFPRLGERLSQPAGTLSGGEQQMLAVGRGLMPEPKLLVLDEPSVGLAPKIVAEIMSTLGRLSKEGLTILLIEQNARAAFKVADRVALMDRGRLLLEGTPTELLADDRVQRAYLGGGLTPVDENEVERTTVSTSVAAQPTTAPPAAPSSPGTTEQE